LYDYLTKGYLRINKYVKVSKIYNCIPQISEDKYIKKYVIYLNYRPTMRKIKFKLFVIIS